MSIRKINYVCTVCGGDKIEFDSTSEFNPDTQQFEHRDNYDHSPVCNSEECQGEEVEIKIVDLITGEHLDSVYGHNDIPLQYLPIAEAQEIKRIRSERWASERDAEKSARRAMQAAEDNAKALASGYEAQT